MNAEMWIPSIISALERQSGKKPCKKTVQKIFYLIEEAGDCVGLDYTIHFYGPYSADLDYELQNLIAKGGLTIEYTKYGHFISTTDKKTAEQNKLDDTAASVINSFGSKTPLELELLATTLFVQRNAEDASELEIASGVKRIKGAKYSDSQINAAIEELHTAHYF